MKEDGSSIDYFTKGKNDMMRYRIRFIVIFILTMLLHSCIVDDTPDREFEELPELTNEGAGMLAFNHETESYIEENGLSNAFYQLTTTGPQLALSTEWDNRAIKLVSIITVGVEIEAGMTLEFRDREPGYAAYLFLYEGGTGGAGATARSNSETVGSITITHFDAANNIVSGTFSTEFEHPLSGNLIKITNGRFDTYFRR